MTSAEKVEFIRTRCTQTPKGEILLGIFDRLVGPAIVRPDPQGSLIEGRAHFSYLTSSRAMDPMAQQALNGLHLRAALNVTDRDAVALEIREKSTDWFPICKWVAGSFAENGELTSSQSSGGNPDKPPILDVRSWRFIPLGQEFRPRFESTRLVVVEGLIQGEVSLAMINHQYQPASSQASENRV